MFPYGLLEHGASTNPIVHVCKMKGLSGCEKQLLVLLPALRAEGCDVRLIILEERDHPMARVAERFADAGVPVERLEMRRHGGPAMLIRLVQRLRALAPAVVHTHLIHADVFGALAARLAGVRRLVSTRHGTHPFYARVPLRQADMVAARLCDQGVAISDFAREFFIANGAFRRERIRTIYYGVKESGEGNPRPWRERGRCEVGEIVVGVIGRLIAGKGQEVFLDAAAVLKRQGCEKDLRYWIVGDGPERERLHRKAVDLGLSDRVMFWGFQEDVPGLLAAMEIVCVPTSPSLREGLNLVLLEAGAAGKAVVASRMGPFPEVVVHGETGMLVEPDNPAQLAATVSDLALEDGLRVRLGAAAERRMRERFSVFRAVAAHRRFYQELGVLAG
jgi:glycosyltransferase involved in cell wall biosynthesis